MIAAVCVINGDEVVKLPGHQSRSGKGRFTFARLVAPSSSTSADSRCRQVGLELRP